MLVRITIIGIAIMFVSSQAVTESRINSVCKEQGLQGRVMWFDAEANLRRLSTRRGVAEMVKKCRAANINTIVVDVKPLSGLTLYRSKVAPRLTSGGGFKYPRNHDLLTAMVEEGHKAGIGVHAAINVFSEGSRIAPGGPAFAHPEWQCVQYDVDRVFVDPDGVKSAVRCANTAYMGGEICLYGDNPETAGELPPNTVYVRVGPDGRALQHGTATGKARLSAPKDGFLLVGNGQAGERLKQRAESGERFQLDGAGVLRRVSEIDNPHHAIFVNPLHPEVRAYELRVIGEICRKYAVDGIVLDRMRYPNIYADFSDLTRREFEKFIGRSVGRWPEDVFTRSPVPGNDVIRGPLFKDWLKFRAKVIRDFLADARKVVKTAKPRASLGIYVGSWYPMYYDVGVNWGSSNHCANYEWWPDGYEETGYAGLVDYMCAGCYYTHPTRKEAADAGDPDWQSVEAAADESVNAVKDATILYGSLYLHQYKGRPDKFLDAIRQCMNKTQGCMLFDLVYVRDYDWWSILKQAFPAPARAPHAARGLPRQTGSRK